MFELNFASLIGFLLAFLRLLKKKKEITREGSTLELVNCKMKRVQANEIERGKKNLA